MKQDPKKQRFKTIATKKFRQFKNVGLKSLYNHRFVSVTQSGHLIADRSSFDKCQIFDIIIIDPRYNLVGLRSHANGKYLCVQKGFFVDEIIANREWLKSWQTFEIRKQGKGYTFKSCENKNYLKLNWYTTNLKINGRKVEDSTTFMIYRKEGEQQWIYQDEKQHSDGEKVGERTGFMITENAKQNPKPRL